MTPGVATPSDVEAALDLGLDVVKFFPAEAAGGVKYLNAISAPYRSVRFIPTGGIDETNLLSYLKLPRVVACGGSWMVKPELINAGKFDEIRTLTSKAVATMLGFELRHVGVNCVDQKEASGAAALAASLFSMPIRQGATSEFVGNGTGIPVHAGTGNARAFRDHNQFHRPGDRVLRTAGYPHDPGITRRKGRETPRHLSGCGSRRILGPSHPAVEAQSADT